MANEAAELQAKQEERKRKHMTTKLVVIEKQSDTMRWQKNYIHSESVDFLFKLNSNIRQYYAL